MNIPKILTFGKTTTKITDKQLKGNKLQFF